MKFISQWKSLRPTQRPSNSSPVLLRELWMFLRFKIISLHFWMVYFYSRVYSFGTTAFLWEIEVENNSTEQSLVQRRTRYYCQYNQICIWIFEYCQQISSSGPKSKPRNIIGRSFNERVVWGNPVQNDFLYYFFIGLYYPPKE